MNRCSNFSRILVVLVVFAVSSILSCTPKIESERINVQSTPAVDDKAESTGGPPPLIVDSDAPLLLDEPTEEQQASAVTATWAAVENAACFVCHANYNSESLARSHAAVNVGCSGCHGQSFAHRNDENNTTPPEQMYPADKINSSCQDCHIFHDVPPGKVVARWTERNPGKPDTDKIVCTDCHGDHRMKVRTIIWDKETGKLLSTNRGE
ncbi:cytochrome c3 family protein [Planctomycetota bacterium]